MSCSSRIRSRWAACALLVATAFFAGACGEIERASEDPRRFIQDIEPDVYYGGAEESEARKYVDYASREITACQWHARLEKAYGSKTGRFRLMGAVDLRIPPKDPGGFSPFFIVKVLLSVVEFVMPWNLFRGVENPVLAKTPWGRVDMKAHTMNSYALITEAGSQIPDREEFKKKVDEALSKNPVGYAKLLLFRAGLKTGAINVDQKRDEIVAEEIQKVFPGLFTAAERQDMSESLSWVLARNGLRQKKDFRDADLKVYARPLPVFRAGGWKALAEDMRVGLGAAVNGWQSGNTQERACASNIIFRSTEQLLQLMGQDTLPLYDAPGNQSYTPSIAHLTGGRNSKRIGRCSSAGSLVRGGRRQAVSERALKKLGDQAHVYSWAESPAFLRYCKPEAGQSATGYRSASSTSLAAMLDRMEAFGHYLFAMNPNARWWNTRAVAHPLGNFAGLKDIQDSGALAPAKVHALALAFLQLDLLHFQERHLVFLDESGARTFDQDAAIGIRLSETPLKDSSATARTTLASTLRFVELLANFERYLISLEAWASSSKATSSRVRALFVDRATLAKILAMDGVPNRETIQQLYLASSLMLLKFTDRDVAGACHAELVTPLRGGVEKASGDCGKQRAALVSALRLLAQKLNSSLLQREADALEGRAPASRNN